MLRASAITCTAAAPALPSRTTRRDQRAQQEYAEKVMQCRSISGRQQNHQQQRVPDIAAALHLSDPLQLLQQQLQLKSAMSESSSPSSSAAAARLTPFPSLWLPCTAKRTCRALSCWPRRHLPRNRYSKIQCGNSTAMGAQLPGAVECIAHDGKRRWSGCGREGGCCVRQRRCRRHVWVEVPRILQPLVSAEQ